jgi:membrane-associated protease RseP (regulator of RpoE activity)
MLLPLLAALLVPQQDPDALKKKILEDVEKRLKAQDEKLLKDIERIIEEEQRRAAGKAPAPAPRAEAPKKARGYLGIRPADLSDDERKASGVKNGVKVEDVVAGGPAEKAGLKKGDVIVAVDGRAVDSPLEVPAIVQAAGAGSTLVIEYVRGKEKGTAKAVLAPHPMDAPAPPKPAEQGKAEEDLRERMKKLLEKKEEGPAPQAKPGEPKKPAPQAEPQQGDDLFAFDEDMFEQFRGLLEQFGADPEQFFEKGKDGKYRFNQDWSRLFKGMDLEKLFKQLPRGVPGIPGLPGFEEEAPAPQAKPPRRAAPEGPLPGVYLGILAEEASDDLRAQLDLEPGVGVFVGQVTANSPAEKAGLKKNDLVLKLDGKAVRGKSGLAELLRAAKPGQEVTLTVLRKAKEQTVKVALAERKEE